MENDVRVTKYRDMISPARRPARRPARPGDRSCGVTCISASRTWWPAGFSRRPEASPYISSSRGTSPHATAISGPEETWDWRRISP